MSDISIAIILVVAAVALVWLFLRYKAKASERRMLQMMQRYGLSPELIAQGDTGAIINGLPTQRKEAMIFAPMRLFLRHSGTPVRLEKVYTAIRHRKE